MNTLYYAYFGLLFPFLHSENNLLELMNHLALQIWKANKHWGTFFVTFVRFMQNSALCGLSLQQLEQINSEHTLLSHTLGWEQHHDKEFPLHISRSITALTPLVRFPASEDLSHPSPSVLILTFKDLAVTLLQITPTSSAFLKFLVRMAWPFLRPSAHAPTSLHVLSPTPRPMPQTTVCSFKFIGTVMRSAHPAVTPLTALNTLHMLTVRYYSKYILKLHYLFSTFF